MADVTTTSADDAAAAAARRHGRAELIAAILLGIAGVLTAFSAYKAAISDGDALEGYTRSTQQLTDANQFYSQALQRSTNDQQLFTQFALETQRANDEVIAYLLTLMDDNLREAVLWWSEAVQAGESVLSPFADHPDNPYVNVDQAEAEAFQAQANETYQEAFASDEEGDRYELAAVLFALTLFFAGIGTLLKRELATWILLGAGTLTTIAGLIVVIAEL